MTKRLLGLKSLFFVLFLIGLATFSYGQTHTCEQVMVPMRDGVKLAMDVYLPVYRGSGPFPVVLTRTPYNKGDCGDVSAQYFAKHGYAALVQDERGRYESEGVYYWLVDNAWHERRDGYDTIEWAGKQSWSNGKVGTMGSSFTCANQFLTAPTKPPSLVAMFCGEFATNPYKDIYYAGGPLHMIMPTWLLSQRELSKPLVENVPGHTGYLGTADSWNRWYDRKQETGRTFNVTMFSEMYQDLIDNPYYNDFWRMIAINEHWTEIDVPIFHFGGWYDRHVHGTVKHYNGIRTTGGPRATNGQKLYIGPWTHGSGSRGTSLIGDIDFGHSAGIDYDALRKRWFDYHLKGINNGIMEEAPVQIFVMGENVWRDEQEFPLSRAIMTDYYLSGTKSQSIDSLNDGSLQLEKPSNETPGSYVYDPRHPVPSIGGDLFVQPNGARDHRDSDRLSLTFTTGPLKQSMEVTGRPMVHFFASSTAVDTDWVVTVSDVHPNGYSQILRQNILRARYREGDEKPVLMNPGSVYEFKISVYPFANLFKMGHRIRLTITSSSFPKWYPNGNTGREMNEDQPPIIATNTIYHDANNLSRITLPIIPRPEGTSNQD